MSELISIKKTLATLVTTATIFVLGSTPPVCDTPGDADNLVRVLLRITAC